MWHPGGADAILSIILVITAGEIYLKLQAVMKLIRENRYPVLIAFSFPNNQLPLSKIDILDTEPERL